MKYIVIWSTCRILRTLGITQKYQRIKIRGINLRTETIPRLRSINVISANLRSTSLSINLHLKKSQGFFSFYESINDLLSDIFITSGNGYFKGARNQIQWWGGIKKSYDQFFSYLRSCPLVLNYRRQFSPKRRLVCRSVFCSRIHVWQMASYDKNLIIILNIHR